MPPQLPAAGWALRPLPLRPLATSRAFFSCSPFAARPQPPPPPPPRRGSPQARRPEDPISASTAASLLSMGQASRQGQAASSSPRGDAASRLLSRFKHRSETFLRNKQSQLDSLRNQKNSSDYLKQMPRRWEAGDVYSPHDLSPVEMQKWRKRSQRRSDVVDALGIRPLDMYKNFSIIQEFTSTSGQITHSSGTCLRPVNQRKVAKMIRRVQGMGIYPTIHDHAEIIRHDFFPRNSLRF